MPVSELVLCQFVTYLAREKLKHRTIKVYLSAIRFLHIEGGMDDPFKPPLLRLEYVMKGIKRCEAQQHNGSRERLPISPSILRKIKAVWEASASDSDIVMLWAACCVAFFGFLRVGEMTVPSNDSYDASMHLSLGDIAVDNPASSTVVRVAMKQSKTDPFRQGVCLYLGKTSTDLCPVAALLNYLVVRGSEPGALFHFKDGRLLTRQRFVEAVKAALHCAGVDQSKYNSHSFRIGAATTAAANGLEDSIVKTLGRWKSLAYLRYVQIPRDQLASYSRLLCS